MLLLETPAAARFRAPGTGPLAHAADPDAIARLDRLFTVEVATDGPARQDAQRLRHQVFCLERGILPGDAIPLESDGHDDACHHVLLRRRRTGEPVGTARLVIGTWRDGGPSGFPMLEYCEPRLLRDLPMGTTAEISRFAISKSRREQGDAADHLLRYALMRGILQASLDLGLTHWCALMEASLLRLLRGAGVRFVALGASVEAHGLRQPSAAGIPGVLESGAERCPDLYRFVARAAA